MNAYVLVSTPVIPSSAPISGTSRTYRPGLISTRCVKKAGFLLLQKLVHHRILTYATLQRQARHGVVLDTQVHPPASPPTPPLTVPSLFPGIEPRIPRAIRKLRILDAILSFHSDTVLSVSVSLARTRAPLSPTSTGHVDFDAAGTGTAFIDITGVGPACVAIRIRGSASWWSAFDVRATSDEQGAGPRAPSNAQDHDEVSGWRGRGRAHGYRRIQRGGQSGRVLVGVKGKEVVRIGADGGEKLRWIHRLRSALADCCIMQRDDAYYACRACGP
ncbi:hypothetical protein C8R44DRAFT_989833 [Mycena epipterygia]|nr:hypothetical protein C8R44DRAFT_989833 [Mycena epipterygia]